MTTLPWLAIVNPVAGGHTAPRRAERLRSELARHGVRCELEESCRPGAAMTLATSARGKVAGIVAVGGDGTVHEVVNGLPGDTDLPLAVLPCGTGNDWARGLSIPTDPAQAARLIAAGCRRQVPVGRVRYRTESGVSERSFLNGVGAGLDTAVLTALPRVGPRRLAYLLGTLRAIRHFEPFTVVMTQGTGRPRQVRATLVYAALGPVAGGGMVLAPRAAARTGRLHCTVVPDLGFWRLVGLLPALYGGTMDRARGIVTGSADSVRWEMPPDRRCEADGQILGTGPIDITVRPVRLNVIAPCQSGDNGDPKSTVAVP